jgi:hypothetical protein
MIHIHLDEAYWCENCQCFIDSAIRCPSCATESNLIPMAQFMPLIHQHIVEISTPNISNRPFGNTKEDADAIDWSQTE